MRVIVRRHLLTVYADILEFTERDQPTLKTRIMYQCNLSGGRVGRYIGKLIELELLKQDSREYRVTAKGHKFLTTYKEMMAAIEPFG